MEKIQQLLDNGELKYNDAPKRHVRAMMVSIVERTCCPASVYVEVHEAGESDLDDELELTDEIDVSENDLGEELRQMNCLPKRTLLILTHPIHRLSVQKLPVWSKHRQPVRRLPLL